MQKKGGKKGRRVKILNVARCECALQVCDCGFSEWIVRIWFICSWAETKFNSIRLDGIGFTILALHSACRMNEIFYSLSGVWTGVAVRSAARSLCIIQMKFIPLHALIFLLGLLWYIVSKVLLLHCSFARSLGAVLILWSIPNLGHAYTYVRIQDGLCEHVWNVFNWISQTFITCL